MLICVVIHCLFVSFSHYRYACGRLTARACICDFYGSPFTWVFSSGFSGFVCEHISLANVCRTSTLLGVLCMRKRGCAHICCGLSNSARPMPCSCVSLITVLVLDPACIGSCRCYACILLRAHFVFASGLTGVLVAWRCIRNSVSSFSWQIASHMAAPSRYA